MTRRLPSAASIRAVVESAAQPTTGIAVQAEEQSDEHPDPCRSAAGRAVRPLDLRDGVHRLVQGPGDVEPVLPGDPARDRHRDLGAPEDGLWRDLGRPDRERPACCRWWPA
ncbi:MAG: hypothetical protein MZU84_04860 [Sphingobacterium sp.]|nr:hypothetical protein [Sphingobacterium sp.]